MLKRIWVLISFLIFTATAGAMELKKVAKNIYVAQGTTGLPSKENRGFMSNSYGILTKEGWIVVDTLSTPELAREFMEALKKIKDVPVLYVVITHYHMDHYFGAKAYRDAGAKVIAHKNLKVFYEEGTAQMVLEGARKGFPGVFDNVELVPPDMVIDSKVKLRVGDSLVEIIPMTPAHTNTDLVVRYEGYLFVGDLVYYKRIPFLGDRNVKTKRWLKVLDTIGKMRFKKLLGGHGDPMGREAVEWTKRYISYVREEVAKWKDEGLFVDEIREKMKDSPFKDSAMYDVFHLRNVYFVFNELDMELE
jgi:glyoxylase-like metal-dependent hydrolase (beta-lactamase superfamily II)